MKPHNRAIRDTRENQLPDGEEKPRVRRTCGNCNGRGTVPDDDPYADRSGGHKTCPTCKGACYLSLLIALLFWVCGANAATVTGTVQDRSGALVSTNINFVALQRPLVAPPYVRPGWTYITNSASDGTFSVFLHAGNYRVTFGAMVADSFIISVPDNTNTYNIGSIATNLISFAHSVAPSTYPLMRGATASADGSSGLVLLPSAGDQNKFWRGDGTWAAVSGGGSGDGLEYDDGNGGGDALEADD